MLTLYENYGMYSLVDYAEKVGLISIVFVVFFLLVTMLVVYSAMTRLFDEERGQIACLKTLGYSDGAIIGRYVWFVTLGTVVGGIIAFGIGVGLTSILYSAFGIQYAMPPFPKAVHYTYYVLTFAIITLSTLLLTYFTGRKIVSAKPAELLTPKAPKKGKKVFLERIGFIWNRLSFKYKSSFRKLYCFSKAWFL